MAYEKQDDQEYEENYKNQHGKQSSQFSAVPQNREKLRKRKIQEVEDSALANSSKFTPSSHSSKMVQYKKPKPNITSSTKSNFSRNKVLDWLKSVDSANAGPICDVDIEADTIDFTLQSNTKDFAPDKVTDILSISSNSSQNKNESFKNDVEKGLIPENNDLINTCLDNGYNDKEDGKDDFVKSFDKEVKQSNSNSSQLQKVQNSQYLKGENHKSKRRKLPKLTSLTDIELRSVPKNLYTEKSVEIQDDLLPDIRITNIKDKQPHFNNKCNGNKSTFSDELSLSKEFSERFQQTEIIFSKSGSSFENNSVLGKKEDKSFKHNSKGKNTCRANAYKPLKKDITKVLEICDNKNDKNFEENAFGSDESDKTENFEEMKSTKNDKNKEYCNLDITANNMIDNDCVVILTEDEIGDDHDSGDKESEATKNFDDNESEVTCNFENKIEERTKFLTNSAPLTFMVNQNDSCTFIGSESDRTQSFQDERNENDNSMLSNDISINQYCMDNKSEKSHILISSDSNASHDDKNKGTRIDSSESRFQCDQNYDIDTQQKDENVSSYNDIDYEKNKQNEIRRKKIEMSQRLSACLTFYSNLETPVNSKIILSSDDEIEDCSISIMHNTTEKIGNSELHHDLENNEISDGESEETKSFNESENTRSFNESEKNKSFNESEKTKTFSESLNEQNSILEKNETENINNENGKTGNHNVLNDENDCVLILSDSESEITRDTNGDNNSESTKDFNDNESVETNKFEIISGGQSNLLNNYDKNDETIIVFDNESEGTHSFKGDLDRNIDTIQDNENVLKHNCVDNKSKKSHILIDSDSDTTHSFEDNAPGNINLLPISDNQSKNTGKSKSVMKQNDGFTFPDDNETTQTELNTNLNNSTNSLDSDDKTWSFNDSEDNDVISLTSLKTNELRKSEMNIHQDEISTDSFQSSSDIEIL